MTEVPTNGALNTLGTCPIPDLGRDAIHLAVVPAIAGDPLWAGEHVSYDPKTQFAKRVIHTDPDAVGIVDPFLSVPVKEGVRFWLIVYPRTIESLRHVWTHPAFPAEARVDSIHVTHVRREFSATPQESEQWLRAYISDHMRLDDNEDSDWRDTITSFIAKAVNSTDDYLVVKGIEANGEIPVVFWDHVENYAGKPVVNRARYFSCSC
jgi:hypothetical protein